MKLVVDSSALVAILRREPGTPILLGHLEAGDPAALGAPTLLETRMVLLGRFGSKIGNALDRLVAEFGIEIVPFGGEHSHAAFDAFRRYGKGRHPAALNFGDCLTYAVAKLAKQPLLCTGRDFEHTDLAVVRP